MQKTALLRFFRSPGGHFAGILGSSDLENGRFGGFSERKNPKKCLKNQNEQKRAVDPEKLCNLGPISDKKQYLSNEAF